MTKPENHWSLVIDHWSLILALSLTVRILTALPIQRPGYMDAYYYYDGAETLFRGRGFSEEFIWNYLDDPAGIPRPSHLYWMPLTSVLAYLPFPLFGASYRAAQLPFVLLSSLLPLIAYGLGIQLTGNRRHALAAALLTIFSGFFTVYWAAPDAFAPFAVAGSLCLWATARGIETGRGRWFALAGVLAGLGHLTRADGLLLLAVPLALTLFHRRNHSPPATRYPLPITHYSLLVACYLLTMLPWFVRNWLAVGTPLPGAGTATAFLRSYDDLFSYGRELSWQSYLAWGWGNILRSKLEAAWINLLRLLAEDMLIFLAPLVIIGVWQKRRHTLTQVFVLYGLLLYLIMTLVFTFPGVRGGLFHSSGALLPFIFAVAMPGLDAVVAWVAARRRGWHAASARRVFTAGAIIVAVLLSGVVYSRAVFAGQWPRAAWNRRDDLYEDVAGWLAANASPQARVMVNNAPGFYYFSHRPCLSIPNEGVDVVLEVADRYGAEFLLLEPNHPAPLEPLYTGATGHLRLRLLETFGDSKLFHIAPSPPPGSRSQGPPGQRRSSVALSLVLSPVEGACPEPVEGLSKGRSEATYASTGSARHRDQASWAYGGAAARLPSRMTWEREP